DRRAARGRGPDVAARAGQADHGLRHRHAARAPRESLSSGRRRHRRRGRPDAGGRMMIFALPDLGEGLQEAEIVAWHVAEGDSVDVDQPLLSVETEKAVVEIPSPRAGRIARLFAAPGDILQVGDPLVELEGNGDAADAPRADEPAA